MAKKSFGSGIDAILGGKQEMKSPKKSEEKIPSKIEELKAIKVCLQIEGELLNNFKALAHWERLSQREMIERLIMDYAKQKGDEYVAEALKSYNIKNGNS